MDNTLVFKLLGKHFAHLYRVCGVLPISLRSDSSGLPVFSYYQSFYNILFLIVLNVVPVYQSYYFTTSNFVLYFRQLVITFLTVSSVLVVSQIVQFKRGLFRNILEMIIMFDDISRFPGVTMKKKSIILTYTMVGLLFIGRGFVMNLSIYETSSACCFLICNLVIFSMETMMYHLVLNVSERFQFLNDELERSNTNSIYEVAFLVYPASGEFHQRGFFGIYLYFLATC